MTTSYVCSAHFILISLSFLNPVGVLQSLSCRYPFTGLWYIIWLNLLPKKKNIVRLFYFYIILYQNNEKMPCTTKYIFT